MAGQQSVRRWQLDSAREAVARAGPYWFGAVIAAAAALVVYFARIQARFAELHAPSSSVVAALARAAVAPRAYALITLALEVAVVLVAAGLASVIFLKEPNRRWGAFVGLMLALLGASLPVSDLLVGAGSRAGTPSWWIAGFAWSLVFVFLYRFPDGRFVPPLMKWFAVVRVAEVMVGTAFPGTIVDAYQWPAALRLADWVFWFGSAIVAQWIRLQSASPTAKQQLRGLSLVVSLLIIAVLVVLTPPILVPDLQATAYVLAIQPAVYICGLAAVVGVALLGAYRPWAVDFVVKRAIVYVALTALLAAIYAVSEKVLSVLLVGMASAPTIIATFVVVLLLTPLRDGLKSLVDRKVKEHKDPVEAVRAITERARSVVQVVDADLLGQKVLDETVKAYKAQLGTLRVARENSTGPAREWMSPAAATLAASDEPDSLDIRHPPVGKPVALLKLRPPRNVPGGYSDHERASLEKVLPEIAEVVRLAEREHERSTRGDRKSARQ